MNHGNPRLSLITNLPEMPCRSSLWDSNEFSMWWCLDGLELDLRIAHIGYKALL